MIKTIQDYKSDDDFYKDLFSQKQFKYILESKENKSLKMLKFYQLFIKYYVHPYFENTRFLVKHGTGSGKTLVGLLVASKFLEEGRNVFIISFNKDRFKTDIDKFSSMININVKNSEVMDRLHIIGYKKLFFSLFNSFSISKSPMININILKKLYNSLIIFDEIHRTYNSIEKNEWGNIVMFINHFFGKNIHILYMSATPITNYTEKNELINYLTFPKENKDVNDILLDANLKKEDNFFSKSVISIFDELINKNYKIYDDAEIIEIIKGKISFVPDLDVSNKPVLNFFGDKLPGTQMIKVIKCEICDAEVDSYDPPLSSLPINSKELVDIPDNYRMPIIKDIGFGKFISNLREEWVSNGTYLKEKGFEFKFLPNFEEAVDIDGPILEHIENISTKYYTLIKLLKNTKGKTLIYHNNNHNNGVSFIANILKKHGYSMLYSNLGDDNICKNCKTTYNNHSKECLKFVSKTFSYINSELKKEDQFKIFEIFNSKENDEGDVIEILIISKMFKEGYDFQTVRNMFIITLPDNIPGLIQLIGRCVRTESHARLPPIENYVNMYILVNTYKNVKLEDYEYSRKWDDFKQIQEFDKTLHTYAINSIYIYPFISAWHNNTESWNLPFKMDDKLYNLVKTNENVNKQLFNALNFYEDEIYALSQIIDLKITKNVAITYDKLLQEITNTPSTPIMKYVSPYFIMNEMFQRGYKLIGNLFIREGNLKINFFNTSNRDSQVKIIDLDYKYFLDNFIEELSQRDNWSVKEWIVIFFSKKNIFHKNCIRYLIETNNNKILINFYGRLTSLFSFEDLEKNNGINLFSNERKNIVGYLSKGKIINYYISKEKKWENVIYNANIKYSDKIVGLVKNDEFLIIETVDLISKPYNDTRKLKRGLNCKSIDFPKLLTYYNYLYDIDHSKKIKKKIICNFIMEKLFENHFSKKNNQIWVIFD